MKLSLVFVSSLLAIVPLQAGLIVGTSGSSNCFPFGCTGSIYQQVYAPSDFPGTLDITSISFFATAGSGGPVTNGTYTLKLSYSANAVNALDTTTFSNNVGAGQVTFGTYIFSGVNAGSGLTFVENNSDFVYNPLTGPLLLEIDLSGAGSAGGATLDAMAGTAGGLFSRAHNFGGGFANYGLVTGFDVSSVPEPATLALSGVGLLALGLWKRRKPRA